MSSEVLKTMLKRPIIRNAIAVLFYVALLVAADSILRKEHIRDLASVPLYLIIYAFAAACAYWANRNSFVTVATGPTRIAFRLLTIIAMTLVLVFIGTLATLRF